jgi:hypothetical protein
VARADDQYQQHIHVFRGIAIILIVCAHTIPSLDWTNNKTLKAIFDTIANQSSIYFFFIAGYLFQHLSTRFSYQGYLLQKLKTVILPYLILSIPALIIFTVLTERIGVWHWFYDLPVWGQISLFLLTGKHLAPLWFVPTIALFYLAAPLFIFIDQRFRRGYWVIVPLLLLSSYTSRGGQLGPLNFAQYLLPVYLLGMAFSRYKTQALELVERWWLLLTFLALLAFFGKAFDWPTPPHWQVTLKVSTALLITWLLFRYHSFIGTRLDYVAEISFGIFFVHAYFILFVKIVSTYAMTGAMYNGRNQSVIEASAFMYGGYVFLVLVFSVSSIWMVKKIFKHRSRMLIGA